MRKLLLTAAAIVTLAATSSAGAADLPPPVITKAPPPMAVALYNWTGFYIGANGGYSWGRSRTNYTAAGLAPFSTAQNVNGGLGGGQIGYNWQFNPNWLIGVEADIQGTGERGSAKLPTVTVPAVVGGAPGSATMGSLTQSLPWFGTVRGRAGFLPADRWLVYGTGGLAYGQVNSTLGTTSTSTAGAVTALNSNSDMTRVGWTAGGGVEWAFIGRWSAKLEYLYMDLGSFNRTFAGEGPYASVATKTHFTDNIFRAGINYSFGGP